MMSKMTDKEFIEKCLINEAQPSLLFSLPTFTSFTKNCIISEFIKYIHSSQKLNVTSWEPTSSEFPEYMLLGTDKGILAYIHFIYIENNTNFKESLLKQRTAPILGMIKKAESNLDRPIFFVYIINCQDKSEIRFETNEQIKDRWFKTNFSDKTYSPEYQEMGDIKNLIEIWHDLKKNCVHFY